MFYKEACYILRQDLFQENMMAMVHGDKIWTNTTVYASSEIVMVVYWVRFNEQSNFKNKLDSYKLTSFNEP